MKKLILFVFVLVAGNVRGQTYYPCSVLPGDFVCYSAAYLDTLNLAEDTSLIVIDTSNSCNTWILGHSYKPVFDSISYPFGIVTDTVLPYTTNIKCSFIVKSTYAYLNPIIMFEHKYENDYKFDGGYIEISCDHGQNWHGVLDYGDYPTAIFFYNYLSLPGFTNSVLHDTIPAFTGTNSDWEWSGFQIFWAPSAMKPDENRWQECFNSPQDSIFYRFTFESDSIDNSKAGWMIRNIGIGGADQGGSISEFSSLPLKLFPNPTTEKISIELPPNSGKLSNILISDIAGNVALRATEAREIDVFTLSPGIYFVLVETDKFVFRQKLVKQ